MYSLLNQHADAVDLSEPMIESMTKWAQQEDLVALARPLRRYSKEEL
jgi:hypothetical protein